MTHFKPIGVFDSGYGGLTILREIKSLMPQYDYLYLGDNARTPYGTRSFETVYQYTKQSVEWLFAQNCSLVILACNTASAKALRSIQQNDLRGDFAHKRVLGVIRPTAEVIGQFSKTNHIGILGTTGTIKSASYLIEIKKYFPEIFVWQQACPLWVPLLGCTHYPLVTGEIKKYLSEEVNIISQGNIVAKSLQDYFVRHPDMEEQCTKNNTVRFCTTDSAEDFTKHAAAFYGEDIKVEHIDL